MNAITYEYICREYDAHYLRRGGVVYHESSSITLIAPQSSPADELTPEAYLSKAMTPLMFLIVLEHYYSEYNILRAIQSRGV